MLRYTTKLLSVGLVILLFSSCDTDFDTPSLVVENQILELVNEHRVSIGKSPLVMNEYITYESRVHSQNMAEGDVAFGHDGFGERVDRIRAKIGGGGAGENVAVGYSSAAQVMDGWLNSPGHRANIEGNFTHIGIGAYQHEGGAIYYTQIFIRK